MFVLDQRLLQDTLPVGDFPLCRLLLSNDSQYPWFILVPRKADISEVFQLSDDELSLPTTEVAKIRCKSETEFPEDLDSAIESFQTLIEESKLC